MSRKAVKFILDILDEQKKTGSGNLSGRGDETPRSPSVLSPDGLDETEIQDRIQQLLADGRNYVNANDSAETQAHEPEKPSDSAGEDISTDYTPQNTYHARLIAPQIQLQSDMNKQQAALIAAKGIQLKVIQIMDKDRVEDDVSGLVQRRFTAVLENMQIFVTSSKDFAKQPLHMYSGHPYGSSSKNSLWPPWVPVEAMFDFDMDPVGFDRVVERTSATMRYDKYNTLRLKYNEDVSGGKGSKTRDPEESRMDHLWVDFPALRAKCDSAQYYALYIIVQNLLLYSEPLEKTRSERLEKIMLASDFSDLTGIPEMVTSLQERIQQLQEIKRHYQVEERNLDRRDWKERIILEQDITVCEDELFFIMKAITKSQQKYEADQASGLLRWYIKAAEIAWHLIGNGSEPLAEFQLRGASYDRTDNSDGSTAHTMEIGRIYGLNLLPNAIYPDMIAPFTDDERPFTANEDNKMFHVEWLMLEAIAGIPVMDRFEINLFPLKVQLEHQIGSLIFHYVFPAAGEKGGVDSPFIAHKQKLPTAHEADEADD
ncbi:hypothetical protein LTS18_011775, partial [Coniosporium uncinatum]